MAGGGVGEAMLIGAAVGGASSAAKGGNVLEGALLGGAMGGIGSGDGGMFGSGGAEAATQAGTQAANLGLSGLEAAAPGVNPAVAQMASGTGAAAGATGGAGISGIAPGVNPIVGQMASGAGGIGELDAAGKAGLLGTGAASPETLAQTGATPAAQPGIMDNAMNWAKKNPMQAAMGAVGIGSLLGGTKPASLSEEKDKYKSTVDLSKFRPSWPGYADGGITTLNQPQTMSVGGGLNYNFAEGGSTSLGGYSDGGRMLRGPGDGMSDSIPATISGKQPARLADGEFVVPADVVSHLGNGSTDAGSKQLYSMMDRVRKARTGSKRQGRQIKPTKMMPA